MSGVFLSYRRDDSAAVCERIYDRLVGGYGKANVFMDVDAIPVGARFPQYVQEVIQRASVVVVVIGPRWLDIAGADGRRRLDDPDDFVRQEVEEALRVGVAIIPVLVEGAKMPRAEQLPASLRDLAARNAIAVRRNPDFDEDMQRLLAAIAPLRQASQRREASGLFALSQALVVAMFALACAGALLVGAILLGLRPPQIGAALAPVIMQSPLAASALSCALLLATGSAVALLRSARPAARSDMLDLSGGWRWPRLATALATSSLSTLALASLLTTTLLRPAWCPSALCPPPQLVTRGVHDANLELYFTALQSDSYELPGGPSGYSLRNAPHQIGALRMDQPQQGAYAVVVGVHSLQQGRFGLIFDQVNVLIAAVPVSPEPLDVWTPGEGVTYHTNLYTTTYSGEPVGASLAAQYAPVPLGKVQLAPGEADDLDVQLSSRVRADIQFQVQVVYRVTNQPADHTLTLPQRFEVVFSDATNWHVYTLGAGGFVAAPQ